ncbi:MAG: hypothetical protein KGM95_10045, partial [Betaproteobacteria bacterium]|nr:hypothetical protein [Betaproteobacteria bacterium]
MDITPAKLTRSVVQLFKNRDDSAIVRKIFLPINPRGTSCMKLPDFPASRTSKAGSKTFSATNRSFLKFSLGAGALSLAFQVFAAEPAPSGGTAVTPATTATPAAPATPATPATSGKFDWSKQPPVTAPPRPGAFSIAPTGP